MWLSRVNTNLYNINGVYIKIKQIRRIIRMKSLFKTTITILIFLLVSFACQGRNPLEEAGDALLDTYEGSKIQAQQTTLKSVQDAVKMYHAQHGRYPESLDEIASLMDTPIDIDMYEYNPEDGKVRLKR